MWVLLSLEPEAFHLILSRSDSKKTAKSAQLFDIYLCNPNIFLLK